MANTMISMNNFAISFMNYYIANLQIKSDNDNHTLEKLNSQTGMMISLLSFLFLRKSPLLPSLCHLLSFCHKKGVFSDTLIVQNNQYKNTK